MGVSDTFDQSYVPTYESYLAAGEPLGGLIPGGQPLLFAGLCAYVWFQSLRDSKET